MKHYGHPEHVRSYGLDYRDRLEESGWSVEIISAEDLLDDSQIALMGITQASGQVYFVKKFDKEDNCFRKLH